MMVLGLLALYLLISLAGTYLLTCIFALSKPLPDRRKRDRRLSLRPNHIDRRLSYRLTKNSFTRNYTNTDQLTQ
jgi:hypothetical protein